MSAWTLRAADRCDASGPFGLSTACGAQAFTRARVEVEVEPGISGPVDLHFCAHHFQRHERVLRRVAVEIVDERERINLRPTPVD